MGHERVKLETHPPLCTMNLSILQLLYTVLYPSPPVLSPLKKSFRKKSLTVIVLSKVKVDLVNFDVNT
jgi:hypothetical protein